MEERSIGSACAMWDKGTHHITYDNKIIIFMNISTSPYIIINVTMGHIIVCCYSIQETRGIGLERGQLKDAGR